MRFHKFHANFKSALWRGVVVIYLLFRKEREGDAINRLREREIEKVVEKKEKQITHKTCQSLECGQ